MELMRHRLRRLLSIAASPLLSGTLAEAVLLLSVAAGRMISSSFRSPASAARDSGVCWRRLGSSGSAPAWRRAVTTSAAASILELLRSCSGSWAQKC